MKIIKKIFNKILFAFIVALVFAFINRCEVKAQESTITMNIPNNEMEVSFTIDTDDYPYYYGTMRYDTSGYFDIYLYFSSDPLYYNSMQSTTCGLNSGYEQNPCYGGLTKSNSSTVYFLKKSYRTSDSELIYSSSSPEVQTKYSGIGYFIVADYNFTDFVENATAFKGYTATGFPKIQDYDILWVLSEDLYNYTNQDTLVLSSLYINELVVPDGPSVEFEARDVKIGDITTSVELKVNFLEYSDAYKYYYQYVPLGDIPDDNNWTRLYYENITHTDDSDYLSMLFDKNGIFYIEIYDYNDDSLSGGGSYEINNIMQKNPEIEFSVDFNSSNSLTIDEVLVNINYLIYGKDSGWNNGEYVEYDYICQYVFLNDNESLNENTNWTTTDCGGHLYVARINGRVAARIVIDDNGYQDIALNTYIVDKIGTLVSDMYDTTPSSNNFFGAYVNNNGLTGLFSSSSGPIRNIVALPLRVGTFIFTFFNMPAVCSPYDMGTIFGHHLIIGCVDLSILGSPLLRTIDIIFAGAFTITWLLFLYKLFRKIVLLRNLNVEDMVKGGIF